MALADFQPERKAIEHHGKPLATVRGISFVDLSVLVRHHRADLMKLYEAATAGDANVLSILMNGDFLVRALTMTPELAARVISLAADEPEGMAGVRRMPLPLQLKLLLEIGTLTFEDVGGPKQFAAMVQLAFGLAAVQEAAPRLAMATTTTH